MDDGCLELGVQGRLEKATDRPLQWASGPGTRAWWSSWIDCSSPSLREWQFQRFEAFSGRFKISGGSAYEMIWQLQAIFIQASRWPDRLLVRKLSDGPVRKCQTASSAQRHNYELNPSPRYALAKLLVQRVQNGWKPCPTENPWSFQV